MVVRGPASFSLLWVARRAWSGVRPEHSINNLFTRTPYRVDLIDSLLTFVRGKPAHNSDPVPIWLLSAAASSSMGKGSGGGRGSGSGSGSGYYLKGGHALVSPSSTEPPILLQESSSIQTSPTLPTSSTLLYHRPKGLLNVGNTCYANAVLQCLLSTALSHALLDPDAGAIFRRYSSNPTLLEQGSGSVDSAELEYYNESDVGNNNDSNNMDDTNSSKSRRRRRPPATDKVLNEHRKWLTRELTVITQEYHMQVPEEAPKTLMDSLFTSFYPTHRNRVVDPGLITRHPHRLAPCLRPYQQEDAHEFLRGLLSTLTLHGQNKQLSSLFDGLLESSVTCQSCNRPSLTRDRYMDLSLDIDQPSITTLADALDHFTATETLRGDNQVYCTRCECKQNADKALRLATAPSILVCHLKRFAIDPHTGRLVRINKHIDVLQRLQIGPYMSKVNKARPPPYDLVAMLVHQGSTCDSGHYVAFVKHSGEWYMCNDSAVSKVDPATVYRQQAYILMYEVADMRSNHGYPSPHTKQRHYVPPQAQNLSSFMMCGIDDTLLGDFCCGSPFFGKHTRHRRRRDTARDDSTLEDSTTASGRHSPLMRATMKRSSSSGNLKERSHSTQHMRSSFVAPAGRPDHVLTKKWTPGELPPRHSSGRNTPTTTTTTTTKKKPKLFRATSKPMQQDHPPPRRRLHRRASSDNHLPPFE